MILDGVSEEIISLQFFHLWLIYGNQLNRFRLLHLPPREKQTKCLVLFGDSECGKSEAAIDIGKRMGGSHWVDCNWYDGYRHQPVIVFDEYHGTMSFSLLKRMVDKTPLNVQVKGSMLAFTSKLIIVLTNAHPFLWYKQKMENYVDRKALCRRLHDVFFCTQLSYTRVNLDCRDGRCLYEDEKTHCYGSDRVYK